jgi:hypothetical protein
MAITNNQIRMVELLIEYANQNNIILEVNEKDVEDLIFKNTHSGLKSISEINIKIFKLLYDQRNRHKILFSKGSEILKQIEKSSISQNRTNSIKKTEKNSVKQQDIFNIKVNSRRYPELSSEHHVRPSQSRNTNTNGFEQ